jgi:bifunctional non-homologous end joining protein LigD
MRANHHIPFRVQPMLATLVAEPFDKPGWVYEEKYDGDRMLAYKEVGRVRLLSRNGKDRTSNFPDIVEAIEKLRPAALLLDGEVVVFDRKRVSRFQLLQQGKGEAIYAVFDCLYADGNDLRHEPLSERRKVLERVVSGNGVLLLSHRLAADGLEAYKIAKRSGYEGLVAKDLSSPYVQKRSKFWLKVKVHQEDEFVIAGYTAPEGSRKYFGALLLGAYEAGKLRYVGKVGTGFDEKTLATLYKQFKPLVSRTTTLADPPPERGVTYLEPKLVAQISYQEVTADKKLRQPVYLGLRDDKRAKEVHLPEASA